MLLKVASGDHLNSEYVNVETGRAAYTTISRSSHTKPRSSSPELPPWTYQIDRFADGTPIPLDTRAGLRHTWILDAAQSVMAEMIFVGPYVVAIKIAGHAPIVGFFSSTELFCNLDNQRRELRALTRVDDFEWVATKSCMTLVDSDDDVAMRYFPRARIDTAGRIRGARLRHGSAFLEVHNRAIEDLSRTAHAELFVTFCVMELLRRGRFGVTRYVAVADADADTHSTLERWCMMVDPRGCVGAARGTMQRLVEGLG